MDHTSIELKLSDPNKVTRAVRVDDHRVRLDFVEGTQIVLNFPYPHRLLPGCVIKLISETRMPLEELL